MQTNKRVPTIYLRAAELLDTKPEDTAVFEDVLHAIMAAKAAGFITYVVEDVSSAQDREEIKNTADYYLQDFLNPDLVI